VIILKTPSPCIPLPLQKGKGEELVKRGSTPLHFPFCISLFYMREGRKDFYKRGKCPSCTPFAAASKKKGECE
jgi:hypothetical protein